VQPALIAWSNCLSLIIHFDICRENAGLLALTHVGSRRVVQISAGFMIFFSILGNSQCCFLHYASRFSIECTFSFKHKQTQIKDTRQTVTEFDSSTLLLHSRIVIVTFVILLLTYKFLSVLHGSGAVDYLLLIG
jgi:hypothetical protein